MISRYEAFLNDKSLSSVSPDILIVDIEYSTPSVETEAFAVANRHGSRVHRRYIGKTSVAIYFMIRNHNTKSRQKICGSVAKWAKNGGVLRINDRDGQRLRCICDTPPVVTSVLRWTDTLRVVFSAYSLPFWEEVAPSFLQLSGTQEEGLLFVPGSVDGAVVEVSIKAGGLLTSVELGINGSTMVLSGLSVPSGQTVVISYDENMIQSIKMGSTSLLDKRTGVDDLLAKCGENNTVTIKSNVPVTVGFSVRGLWL